MSQLMDLKRFLVTPEPADLGPGPRPGVQPLEVLKRQIEPLLEPTGFSRERQDLIRAVILLWHDHLDAAHGLAQRIDTVDGAFVHGIMHRREPDFGNAAYWFRRAGQHPAYAEIALEVAAVLGSASESELVGKLIHNREWDPFAFIDACAKASSGPLANQRLLREIQRVEFSILMDSLCASV
jgi:hypothetical protein